MKIKHAFSETIWPLLTIFCMQTFAYMEMKIYYYDAGYMTKMAAMPIYIKKPLKNLLLGNQQTDFHKTWYVALGTPTHYSLLK